MICYYFSYTKHGRRMYRHDGDAKVDDNGYVVIGQPTRFRDFIIFDDAGTPPQLVRWQYSGPLPWKYRRRLPAVCVNCEGDISKTCTGEVLLRAQPSP